MFHYKEQQILHWSYFLSFSNILRLICPKLFGKIVGYQTGHFTRFKNKNAYLLSFWCIYGAAKRVEISCLVNNS